MKRELYTTVSMSSSMFNSSQDLINYALENKYEAIYYSFKKGTNGIFDLSQAETFIKDIKKHTFDIRYHCPFFNSIEIAHADKDRAENSLQTLKSCVDLASDYGGRFMTIHIGLGFKSLEELNYDHAIRNLSDLVNYGYRKNLTICLENLTFAWTNDPESFLELIEKTGASATVDLGHINASPWVTEMGGSNVDFLKIMAPHIVEAHVYEIERIDEKTSLPYHVAPQNLAVLRPLLQELRKTECNWWLIELNDKFELEHTRKLLQSFLG